MENIQKWQEEKFLPWKKAMEEHNNKQLQMQTAVKQNADKIKHMIALLLEGKETKAVAIWNETGMEPKLIAIDFNIENNTVVMVTDKEEKLSASVDALLADLQNMIAK